MPEAAGVAPAGVMSGRGGARGRARVGLVHWDPPEAPARAGALRDAGYDVVLEAPGPEMIRRMEKAPPAALIIDLSRRPSTGRDVGLAVRQRRATRRVPLIFVGGEAETVAGVRRLLPDAAFTTWGRLPGALRRVIASPPADPVAPGSVLAGYSGTPLPKKLGIRGGSTVALVGAPAGFERTLGALPEGARVRRGGRGARDLTLWFVTSERELWRRLPALKPAAAGGGLWIVWPKQTSGMTSDLREQTVREAGLAAGLVDFKVCAVDAAWSGLRFSIRKPARGRGRGGRS